MTTSPTQEPRPKTPSASTLASPTSQITAWYRYAVSLELGISKLKEERDTSVAISDALLGVQALRDRLAALEGQVVPADDYAALNGRLVATQQHNMYLAGQLNRLTSTT